jgi:hypothetical protein
MQIKYFMKPKTISQTLTPPKTSKCEALDILQKQMAQKC